MTGPEHPIAVARLPSIVEIVAGKLAKRRTAVT
jgi:hypothetical protein